LQFYIGDEDLTWMVFTGAAGYTPADEVDFTCGNADVTLTLCPGTTSDYS